jgi:hypothetical protein
VKHAYPDSVIDYYEVSQALKQKYNSNKIDRNTPFILRGFPLLNTTLMRSETKKRKKKKMKAQKEKYVSFRHMKTYYFPMLVYIRP